MTEEVGSTPPTHEIERAFREAHGQAVATLIRLFGDVGLAEDAVQDAFEVAHDRWRRNGVPPNPAGWIITTARNRAVDHLRRESRGQDLQIRRAHEEALMMNDAPEDVGPVTDDQLRLIFMCCHPALRPEHQVALTLRLLGGLTVDEIARSFLVSESTMSKRLVRAKYKIKAAGIPYRVPRDADLPGRLQTVLTVVYLIYNTGADDPLRENLRAQAIRLGRSVAQLMPDEPEPLGLLALLLLNESRMSARFADGDVVLLQAQDRSLWDAALIDEGQELVRLCIRRNQPGPFQIQAAIQAVHSHAPTFGETDWPQILTLYDQLCEIAPTPVVAMNRAIVVAEVDSAELALAELDEMSDVLSSYHLFHAVRGTLLRRVGRSDEAMQAFALAATHATHERDIRFLEAQMTPSS